MNLVQPLRAWGHEVITLRNDALSVAELLALSPERIVLSPGPNRPEDAGVCVELVSAAAQAGVPVLGVCLGHQCVAQAFGAKVVEGAPMHGEASDVFHDSLGLFASLPSPLRAARYHSLVVSGELPTTLERSAWTEDGVVMGLRHRTLPVAGVQFHPESFLTPLGESVLRNFVAQDTRDT